MVRAPSVYGWTFVVGLSFAVPAAAVERTTDAERSYRAIRYSNDAATQLLAQRWYGLVRLQDWTDTTGRFTTRAKYVEHDPALEWVKLRVIQGSGDKRIVKDIDVPMEKLSALCRSRVRQIAFLEAKIAAAVVAEQQAADEQADQEGAETFGRAGDPRGAPGMESAVVDRSGVPLVSRAGDRANPGAALGDVTGRDAGVPLARIGGGGEPLPAMLPPLPGGALPSMAESATVAAETAEAADGPTESAKPAPPPNLTDDDPWRTDYEVFRANFTNARDGSLLLRQRWAGVARMLELADIDQQMREQAGPRSDRGADPASFLPPDFSEGLGEFVWEATISQPVGADAIWTDVLNLPPLLRPLRLEFRLDEEQGSGHWRQLQVGDRVHFIGRLAGFAGSNLWVVAIRFPEDQPAGEDATDANQLLIERR